MLHCATKQTIGSFAEQREERLTMARGMHASKKIATVKKWKASGLTQTEFCRREGLQQWQLSEWKRFARSVEESSDDLPARCGAKAGVDPPDDSRTERKNAGCLTCRPGQAATAELQPFVPVRLVDVDAGDSSQNVTAYFDSVLEVVLKRGRIVRVTSSCEPQFLHAVVTTLELL